MTPTLRSLGGAELSDWLRLSRTDTIGPRTFHALLRRFGSARAALAALPRLGAGRAVTPAPQAAVEDELRAIDRDGLRLLPVCDPAFPPSLRAIADAPPLLVVQGDAAILQRSMVAVVGSRNASANGLLFTERLARGVGAAGHVIVSGLARGIDARAHLASLASGTVAVLAGGHRRVYPSEHRDLALRIAAEGGAVVSEMPLAWEPRGRDFPRRNRIVAGLALGVVVVEAARRSGSLITARFANEQGREVFAVPGSPFDPRSEGTNDLLRAGATFCTAAEDVTAALAPMLAGRTVLDMRDAGPEAEGDLYWDEADGLAADDPDQPSGEAEAATLSPRERITRLIGPSPVSIDDLVRASDVPVQTVQALLVELELDGVIRRQGANGVARSPG